jgi:hypothetical protein
MRALLHVLLAVAIALQGLAAQARPCAAGHVVASADARADGGVATPAIASGHEHCPGHAEDAATPLAADTPDRPDRPEPGCPDDCCGTGACGCPCATPPALPVMVPAAVGALTPAGPEATASGGRPLLAPTPPLRPPIA